MAGYPALLAVLSEEAAREAAAIRAAAEGERDRLLQAARRDAEASVAERLARARAEAAAALRAARDAASLERERAAFLERRRQLDALRSSVEAGLLEAWEPDALERLLPELLAEAGDGPLTIVVDPGDEEACRRILSAIPGVAARARVVAGDERRGGATVIAGRLVLDGTLRSRLDRAWAALEPELARRLFGEGG